MWPHFTESAVQLETLQGQGYEAEAMKHSRVPVPTS